MSEDLDWTAREEAFVERATRIVRLLAWMMALACAVLVFGILASVAARAEEPLAAARELGRAGQAAAGAIARDASSSGKVPGYAGTDVPERDLTAAGMEDAARAALADPDDPGGEAGRAVIEGALVRPDASVPASDPGVRRAEAVAADAQAPAHGASGLASGGVADCDAGLADAGTGGACGGVRYCVGAGCETVRPEANTGFARSTAMLNMVLEMGGEEFDREDLRFFTGERRACTIKWGGLANCCKNTGLLVGIGGCSEAEYELAQERHDGNTHYLGKRCAKRTFFGFCIRRERVWCVFGSKLGRILHEQARGQLGIDWGSCRGFTVAEVEAIDFDALDLSEFTENLVDGGKEPAVSLPEAGDTQSLMRTRIRDFYQRNE